jgi:DNA-binding response OmpR family regulator
VFLQPREFELLAYLVKEAGVVLRREQILAAVWRHDFVGERTVDVHIRRLRAKLEAAGAAGLIHTMHGVGYSLHCGSETQVC